MSDFHPDGWVNLRAAASHLGIGYETLRQMVKGGVFTVGRFSLAKKRPPVFLRVEEVEAFKTHGVEGVAACRTTRLTVKRA